MTAPRPPLDLADRKAVVVRVSRGVIIHRFFRASLSPVFFDASLESLLNAPDGSYGMLYAAERAHGAFAETFLRTPGRRLIPRDMMAERALVRLGVTRDLALAALHGPGLARLGATAEVTHSGEPYDIPQAWSAALHAHRAAFDGIAYTSRHDDDEICYALFDRARDGIAESERFVDLDQDWFHDLTEHYGVGMAPDIL